MNLVETVKRKTPPLKKLAFTTFAGFRKLIKQLAGNEITLGEFEARVEALLFESHARASVIGRNISGDLTPMTAEDRLLASLVVDGEKRFLNKFINDIRSGKYTLEDGALHVIPIERRAVLYTTKLRGTMHESFVNVSKTGSTFDWILIAEDNCSDCPRIAAGSPYTAATLPTYPGNGETECITNCKCVLMRDDGVVTESYPYETVEELVGEVV